MDHTSYIDPILTILFRELSSHPTILSFKFLHQSSRTWVFPVFSLGGLWLRGETSGGGRKAKSYRSGQATCLERSEHLDRYLISILESLPRLGHYYVHI
jgi:hypothetical protein